MLNCKFEKLYINRYKRAYKNVEYIPKIIELFKRFSAYLYDDYHLETEDILEATISLIESCREYFWVIIDDETRDLMGFAYLENLIGGGGKIHSAEVTTCFYPRYWGNSTKVAAKKFIKYCFKKIKLKKLKALVFEQNFKTKAILKYVGFKKEALLKGETLKNGKMQNIVIYSILKKGERGKNEN